jgi:protein TonB
MFEDSIFESAGKIHTHSRGWMLAAFLLNGSLLLAMILIPLIYPEALPLIPQIALLEVPTPPTPPPTPVKVDPKPFHGQSEMNNGQILAPPRIPTTIAEYDKGEDLPPGDSIKMESGIGNGAGSNDSPFHGTVAPRVHPEIKAPVRMTCSVVASMLVHKTIPVYPPIATAAHVEGTVVLQATISAAGTIENLHVASGPAMLRQAALDAVKTWRYRPFELNGEPVEVETTVNVIFSLNR